MIKTKYPLLEHQKKAYDKLKKLKVGALYMDMGTGKTRTAIEIIKDKINAGKVEKVIWFCPCSAKENIRRELLKQLEEGFEHFIIVGIESVSSSVRLNSILYKFVEKYECLMIVDESSKIKNHEAKRTQRITQLGEKCKYRYILNGTPISRDERDLFSQWYFLDWRILGYRSVWSFSNNHVVYDKTIKTKVKGTKNTEYLSKKIAPYTYQVKLDECVELPQKVYETKYFNLTGQQWYEYERLGNELIAELDDWKPSTIYRMFNILQSVTAGFSFDKQTKTGYDSNPKTNNRLELLLDTVEELDGKIIIFCEFKAEVEAIIDLLSKKYGEDSVVPFYGEISMKKRNESIKKFEDKARFLVANKDCAGYSLNLQFCNKIIYFNNDWDFGTRLQSEDRIHRIGQENKCLYIDIVASNTLEEHIISCLDRKNRLANYFMKDVETVKDLRKIIGLKETKKGEIEEEIVVIDDLEV